MKSLEQISFLVLDEILYLHQLQIEEYGGSDGIRDRGLLESAIAMPEASFAGVFVHTSVFEMAAAYAFHIAENQPFIDGNKRTALATALVFLDINFIELDDPEEKFFDAMINLAIKKLDKKGLAQLFESLSIF